MLCVAATHVPNRGLENEYIFGYNFVLIKLRLCIQENYVNNAMSRITLFISHAKAQRGAKKDWCQADGLCYFITYDGVIVAIVIV